jgi:hypothetical protein
VVPLPWTDHWLAAGPRLPRSRVAVTHEPLTRDPCDFDQSKLRINCCKNEIIHTSSMFHKAEHLDADPARTSMYAGDRYADQSLRSPIAIYSLLPTNHLTNSVNLSAAFSLERDAHEESKNSFRRPSMLTCKLPDSLPRPAASLPRPADSSRRLSGTPTHACYLHYFDQFYKLL